jgi:hypothetical protein
MIEIGACAADFAQLVAAESAPNRGFRQFADVFIRRNPIRGHDENTPETAEFGDRGLVKRTRPWQRPGSPEQRFPELAVLG